MLGNPGQPTTARPAPEPDPEPDEALRAPISLPAPCIRAMNSFRPECQPDCAGVQRDGGCLAVLVAEAAGRGRKLLLELDSDGVWTPIGEEPLP